MDRLSPAAKALLRAYREGAPGPQGAAANYRAVVARVQGSERSAPQRSAPERSAPQRAAREWPRQLGWGLASAAAAVVLLVLVDAFLPEATVVQRELSGAPGEALDRAGEGSGGTLVRERPKPDNVHPVAPQPTPAGAPTALPDAATPAAKPSAPALVAAAPDGLAEETRLLRLTREALRRDDLSAARVALDEHRKRFPEGALAEDRAAYDAIVGCRAGVGGLQERRAAFDRAYPRSPHAPRVADACGRAP